MNKTIKYIVSIVLAIILCTTGALPAFAEEDAKPSDLQKNVVYITGQATYWSSNYNIGFSVAWSGTGFAVGTPGEPVQYIATCDHVASQVSGVYDVYVDGTSVMDYKLLEEGTDYPYAYTDSKTGYTVIRDHFNPKTDRLYAVFSEGSNDKVKLSLVERNEGSDVAICKIASDPVDKIVARPLKLNKDVNVGDDVYVIGYPFISDYADDEKKIDYNDSTVYSGIVSKKTLTYGTRGSKVQYNTYMLDASMTNGNSGGPIFTKDGAIIGVASFGTIDAYKAISANYAVCIDELTPLLDKLSIKYEVYDSSAPAATENTSSDNNTSEDANTNNNTNTDNTDSGSPNTVMIIAIAAAAVLVIAAVIIIVAMNNKKKAQAPADNTPINSAPQAAPASASKFYLIGVTGLFAGKKFAIDERIVIGRDKSRCNITYPEGHPGISSVHCEISKVGSTITIKDCGSTYGTFLFDGAKLTANVPVILKSGDKFMVADKENVFEIRY